MFLPNSRYYNQKLVDAVAADGRQVQAVALRRLPSPAADPAVVQGNDRLDIVAERKYGDSTQFWHVADANTELFAPALTKVPGRIIQVPDK
jgi:hypothetical protein